MPRCTASLDHSDCVTDTAGLIKIRSRMNKATCSSDPFHNRLLKSHLHVSIPILQNIVYYKSSIVIHLIKKPSID